MPLHATVIREPSDSYLAASLISLAPSSPVALISLVTRQDILLPSYLGPTPEASTNRKKVNKHSIELISLANN